MKKRSQFDLMRPLFDAIAGSDLTSTQRLLLIGLFRYMDGDGKCYPSYKALIEITGLSNKTISTQIKELVRKGWITYKPGSGATSTSNTYRLNLEKIGITKDQIQGHLQQTDKEPVKRIKGRLMTERDAIAGGYDWIDEITGK